MPYQPTPELVIDYDGPVAIVTLNNPGQMNACNDAMHDGLQEIWTYLGNERTVRTIVLTGKGQAFSAGGDIANFQRLYEDPIYRSIQMRGAMRVLNAMLECPKPMIAAVNGPAVGLGCSLAVSCDIVLIAESAYMSDPHASIGLVAGDGGAVTWPSMMSILKAKYYLLTGDRIPAADCVELGLANKVYCADEVLSEAIKLAHRLAEKPRQAQEETKRAVNLHLQAAMLRVGPFAAAAEQESFTTDDLRQTIERFKAKMENSAAGS